MPRRVQLLIFALVLPLSVNASAQAGRGTEPFARIAYVKWTCAHYLSSIVAADVAGRHREMITRPERCRHFGADEYPRSDEWPRWAADGKSVAFKRFAGPKQRGVYVWTRGKESRRIHPALVDLPPAWSPDGRLLALATESLWLKDRQGGNMRILARGTPRTAIQIIRVEWSPDGSRLMFLRGDGDLRIVPVAGGRPRLIAKDVYRAAWSPDARRIAYAASCRVLPGDEWVCRLYVVSANGGKAKHFPFTARGMSLAWERKGEHVLVGSTDPGHGLRVVDVGTGRVRTAIRDWIELAPTTGPRRGDLRLVRILRHGTTGRALLAFITSTGQIKTRIVVPRGFSTDDVAAYIP